MLIQQNKAGFVASKFFFENSTAKVWQISRCTLPLHSVTERHVEAIRPSAVLVGIVRDVAQSGLEYTSGGRGVAGSNPVIPTFFAIAGKSSV